MSHTLQREVFEASRLLEFFSEKELTMQMGATPPYWPMILLKELIDNALDACETAGLAPDIHVTVEPDALIVRDEGPDLPVATLTRSLNYAVRVSDKLHYVSPSRGQLGNALKCLWAAPYVRCGDQGAVEVVTSGTIHWITVSLGRIEQRPVLQLVTSPDGFVKNGTLIKVSWPRVAKAIPTTEPGGRFLQIGHGAARGLCSVQSACQLDLP